MTHPASQVDLTNCDREPIHIPGAIQSHAVLVVLSDPDLLVTQVSANTETKFGIAPGALLGRPLAALLPESDLRYVVSRVLPTLQDDKPQYLPRMQIGSLGRWFEPIIHRRAGLLLLELETQLDADESHATEIFVSLKNALVTLYDASSVVTLCQRAAELVRRFTGFDRVMVYQFLDDASGRVIAEEHGDDMEPYLGLHYPASDIPKQARALYLQSWLRLKMDVNDVSVPLVPALNPITKAPLDMSYAIVRSMSPVHVEYLRNMGVRSSMSISIINNNELWGLVACHNSTLKYVPHAARTACELLGHMLSLQLGATANAENQANVARLNRIHAQFVERMAVGKYYQDALIKGEPALHGWLNASGVALCGGSVRLLGQTPNEDAVRRLVAWLDHNQDAPVFATHALPERFPEAAAYADVASGLLSARLSKFTSEYILWFRPEYRHSVSWAGDPSKPVVSDASGERLTPRTSFALWQQEVARRSAPWKDYEREAAAMLRRSILEVVVRRAEELLKLNAELERSNTELDSFAYIASHDLKEPLRGLHNYSHFLLEDYADKLDEDGVDKLTTLVRLTQRMESLLDSLLYYSQVGRTELGVDEANLQQELNDVLLLLGQRIDESGAEIRIPRPLPSVRADRVRVGEIFANLISNALKYNTKSDKWVEIGFVEAPLVVGGETRTGQVFYVRDNGIGIAPQHHEAIFRIFKRLHGREAYGGGVGAGLTIARKIVERHGGTIWLESQPGQGTTFYFTLAEGIVDTRMLGDQYKRTPYDNLA